MERRKFCYYLLGGAIAFASCLFTSCTEHVDDPEAITAKFIVINYSDTVIDVHPKPVSSTRTQDNSVKRSSVLSSKAGKKMYLRCTESPWPSEKPAITRGSKTTTGGISCLGVSASVYPAANSYTSAGCGSYFYKEAVESGTPTMYYWPTADYKISFFGYYPYDNAAFTVQSAASALGAPTYAYTVPSVIANQQDVMTGQMTNVAGGSAAPEKVYMTLSHRTSAIHFNITNDRSQAITVNSISIEGIKYTGTLNENIWTLGGSVNTSSVNPFTLTYGSSIEAGETVDITGTSNIFLMLPQTLLATAKLKVVVDDEEFETELTGTWLPGKEYSYSISVTQTEVNYLKFKAEEAGTFTFTIPANVNTSSLQEVSYSLDGGRTWIRTANNSSAVTITTPTVDAGDSVLWKGIGTQ